MYTAQRCNAAAFEAIRTQYHRGMSEADIRDTVAAAWQHVSGEVCPFSGDIVGGRRSAAIGGEATDYVLREGDALIVDVQPFSEGLYADTTRTFFIGEPSEEQRRVYEAVIATLSRMEAVLKPGARACDVYAEMQASFAEYGLACPHHAGHALGSDKLLPPEFLPEVTEPLREGMFVALEPGAYIGEAFGIRVENNYRITADGAECVFTYPLAIENFIL